MSTPTQTVDAFLASLPTTKRPRAARGAVVLYRPKNVQTYYLRYSKAGKQVHEPTGTRDPKVAERLRKEREAQLRLGLAIPQATRTTWDQLADLVKDDFKVNAKRAADRTDDALAHLAAYFAGWRAAAITTDRIVRYQRHRQDAKAANSTINRECGVLKRAFNLGKQVGKVETVPYCPRLRENAPRQGFFDPAEVTAVLGHLPAYAQPAVEFLYLTGWRLNEVLRLTWAQVDFTAGCVLLEPGTTKSGDGRTFPFAALPRLEALLRAQRKAADDEARKRGRLSPWVFTRQGRRLGSFRKTWAAATTAAGCPGRLLHDFRRTAVRNLERAGVPRSVAMQLVGHKSQAIYTRYAIVAERDLADGVARLAQLHAATPPGGEEPRKVVPLAAIGKK